VSECVLLGMGSAHAGAFPGKNSLYSIPHTLYNRCMVLANANMWPSTDQRAMQPATFRHNHLVSQPSAPCHQPPALLGDNKITLNKQHIHPATLLDNRMRVLEEYDDAGTPARQAYFVWGTYVDELLLVNDDADDDADYYACRDHLYSVHVLYNPTTGIAERYDYDAYGQPTIYTADGGDSDWWDGDEDPNNESLINNAYTFTGRRLDTLDSGDLVIMYYRARYYSPNTGRFLSRDPIGHKDGMNLYQYVISSPVKYMDPYGLEIPPELDDSVSPDHGGGQDWLFDPASVSTEYSQCKINWQAVADGSSTFFGGLADAAASGAAIAVTGGGASAAGASAVFINGQYAMGIGIAQIVEGFYGNDEYLPSSIPGAWVCAVAGEDGGKIADAVTSVGIGKGSPGSIAGVCGKYIAEALVDGTFSLFCEYSDGNPNSPCSEVVPIEEVLAPFYDIDAAYELFTGEDSGMDTWY